MELYFMSLLMFLPALHPPYPLLHLHISLKQTLRGRQERYEHPHFIGGEAEAGPPNSRRSLGSWVSQGYFGASVLHRVTFCCQFPSCLEAGLASHKLPQAFWSLIRSEFWLRQDN